MFPSGGDRGSRGGMEEKGGELWFAGTRFMCKTKGGFCAIFEVKKWIVSILKDRTFFFPWRASQLVTCCVQTSQPPPRLLPWGLYCFFSGSRRSGHCVGEREGSISLCTQRARKTHPPPPPLLLYPSLPLSLFRFFPSLVTGKGSIFLSIFGQREQSQ